MAWFLKESNILFVLDLYIELVSLEVFQNVRGCLVEKPESCTPLKSLCSVRTCLSPVKYHVFNYIHHAALYRA